MKHLNLYGPGFPVERWGLMEDAKTKTQFYGVEVSAHLTCPLSEGGSVLAKLQPPVLSLQEKLFVATIVSDRKGEEQNFFYFGEDEEEAGRRARGFSHSSYWRARVQGFQGFEEDRSFSDIDRLLVTVVYGGDLGKFYGILGGSVSPRPPKIVSEVSVRGERSRGLALAAVFKPNNHLVIRVSGEKEDDFADKVIVLSYHGVSDQPIFRSRVLPLLRWKGDADLLDAV